MRGMLALTPPLSPRRGRIIRPRVAEMKALSGRTVSETKQGGADCKQDGQIVSGLVLTLDRDLALNPRIQEITIKSKGKSKLLKAVA